MRSPVLELLGSTVRELRVRKKISQQRLADLAGLGRVYINGIERGRRNPGSITLVRIAVALDITPGELFKRFSRSVLRDMDFPA